MSRLFDVVMSFADAGIKLGNQPLSNRLSASASARVG